MARKKLTIDKYNYGSYVIMNQQQGEPTTAKANVGGSALSGAASGASALSFAGPWGMAVGAVGGALFGGLSASAKNRRREQEQLRLNTQSLTNYGLTYNTNIDSINENPYGTYQDGGDVKEKQDPLTNNKQFYTNYMLSPNYLSRLQGMGYSDPYRTISDRLSNVNQTGMVNLDNWGSRYNPDNKTIIIDPQEIKKYGDNPNTVISHELAHAAGAKGYNPDDVRLNNLSLNRNEILSINQINNQLGEGHDGRAAEFKADLDAFRYRLKQDNIYDTGTEEFNKSLLKRAKDKYKNDNYIKRLFDRASDDDLIWAMNNIASVNQNNEIPIAANGGDIMSTQINIEKGELQIDPETGKILREFTGINPETGGLYEPHAKGRKKDSDNNIVTANEGDFIITKAKAKEYKDAINNNDKLAQNSIMHNIRNKKRQSMKFADGGLVKPVTTFAGVTPNTTLTTQTRNLLAPVNSTGVTANTTLNKGPNTLPVVNVQKSPVINMNTNNTQSNFNWGNLIEALPAVTNLIQGFSSPNYLQGSRSPVNPYRNQILGNMPRDINYSPLFNRIYRDRNTAYGLIDNTTNSAPIARANKLNVMANTQRGIQDVYFQGEDMNNRVRTQRAGMYDSLGQQELAQFERDRQFTYGVDLTNRQMQEGRRQQVNYGLSQLGELYQQRQLNAQLRNRDYDLMGLLPQIYPALEPYLRNYRGGNR